MAAAAERMARVRVRVRCGCGGRGDLVDVGVEGAGLGNLDLAPLDGCPVPLQRPAVTEQSDE
eukprot:1720160-Rhodomonas_salina.1